MVDRYSITCSGEQLSQTFSVDVPDFYQPAYNASPTRLLPVITLSGRGGLSAFYWGTSPEWSRNKAVGEKLINLKAEIINEKPALRRTMAKNRCLIPADGFYAWKQLGKKTAVPYRFVLANREPFGIAGLWEEFEDTDGNQIHTFQMITTSANALVSGTSAQMPAILQKTQWEMWLNPEQQVDALIELLKPLDAQLMDHYPVTPAISNKDAEGAILIKATPPTDQFGNLTLFD